MPAERRTFTSARPVKTERTHEENQERAYIAASRRSDRSLEARIESARRASEIHKKRTGRALRVTEQDVINEEMYEEEDDDLPTQYQRLNAHLHTTSVMFNKKLHDYIATQHGVRNMFMSQYQNHPQQQYAAGQYPPNAPYPQANNWSSPDMLCLSQLKPGSSQGYQQAQPYAPAGAPQQQGFRHAPYHVPQRLQRPQPHQRSLSIQMPPAANFESVQHPGSGATSPQNDPGRRMSMPPRPFEHQAHNSADVKPRPALSQSPIAQPVQQRQSASSQSASPETDSVHQSPRLHNDADAPASYTYSPTNYPYSSQVLNTNPLSMSLPPESQQLIGSALDPNDPRTALFMAGSDNLPQPFAPTYTYNPNLLKGRASGSAQTLSSGLSLKLEPDASPSTGFYNNDSFLTPGNGDYNTFFDFQGSNYAQPGDEHGANDQLDGNNFVNWD